MLPTTFIPGKVLKLVLNRNAPSSPQKKINDGIDDCLYINII